MYQRLSAAALSMGILLPFLVSAQVPDSLRVILRTGSTCYLDADRSKPYGGGHYYIGDTVRAVRSKKGADGRTWYADSWRGTSCWVDGAASIPLDRAHPEVTAAALADSLLARKAGFEGTLELLTKFELWDPASKAAFEKYPLLAFKRLQLIDRVASLTNGRSARKTPHELAFIAAHQEVLRYFDPSGDWRVPGAEFFKIVDANPNEPWGDDAAWVGATQPPGGDECYASCWVAMIVQGVGEYWKRFPNGRHARESFIQAAGMTSNAISTSRDEPATRKEVLALRDLIPASSLPERARLMEAIAALERLAKP